MSNFTFAVLSAALATRIAPKVVATANRRAPLLRFLDVRSGAGITCTWPVENDGANAENFSDGADVANYSSDVPALVTLNWGLYRANFQNTMLAVSVAATSRDPAGLLNAFARQMVQSSAKLAGTLNGAGYSGAGTGTLVAGLGMALRDDNTYGGIDRTQVANSYLRATVIDPGGLTDPTLALIRSDLGAIQDACGEKPDLAFVSTAVWNKIAGLFTDVRRYDRDVLAINRGMVTMDASVDAIIIDGCAFIKDKDATANAIFYVNSQYVYWQYLPISQLDMESLVGGSVEAAMDDGAGPLPLGMKVFNIARTGAAEKFMAAVQCQLVVEKPNACGQRLNVKVT